MLTGLPLLPTMGVGSHAAPGWLFSFREAMRAGKAGPADVDEAYGDATRTAIADQIQAGLDVFSDGELTRDRFVYAMYDRLEGLTRQSVARRLGVPGYDRTPGYVADERVRAPNGLGLVEDYQFLRREVARQLGDAAAATRLKMALPGPITFVRSIRAGRAYAAEADPQHALLADLVALIRAEVAALVAAGCPLVQLDEPGLTYPLDWLGQAEAVAAINRVGEAAPDAFAVHVCFGNNASRPYTPRDFDRLQPALETLSADWLVLEFANREMAGLDLVAALANPARIAAGVVDVKSFHQESADDVARRIDLVLAAGIPAERLALTADCGLSAIPRWLGVRKLEALAAGAALVRGRA
ncbi:MAG: cobalamin-independent methionine synthase II family protein [Alphaproteobacteria bacterium]|nr:cobalamin-independent methionine synthase II family protein [Alphaproteobacteria bacterium]MCB9928259.1 cobalamin-independent methionine synthase II family protein [Alphaproteobacteria bacterium]